MRRDFMCAFISRTFVQSFLDELVGAVQPYSLFGCPLTGFVSGTTSGGSCTRSVCQTEVGRLASEADVP